MAGPSVLCVILNYRTAEMTMAACEATRAAMDGIEGEIVIVDNDSHDGSFEALAEAARDRGWDRVRVLQSGHNGGYGAGNNFGIRAGLSDGRRPDYVYIQNSDAEPEPEAIRALVEHMQAEPRCGIAGSYIYGPENGWHSTCFRFPSIAGEFEDAARIGAISRLLARHIVTMPKPEGAGPVDWLCGASAMLRSDMLDTVGGFDEGFFLYFDETDLCRRVWNAGWRVDWVPESRVAHHSGVSTGREDWTRVPGYWFESRNRYFTKHHGRVYAAVATAMRAIGVLIWRVKRLVTGHPRVDPPRFLRDLIRHALPRRRTRRASPTPAAKRRQA